jgi:Xaa-Pro aminopeptidase
MPIAAAELPFDREEYQARMGRLCASLERRGIDVLYVTSPANLCYLTGYEAIWYPGRLPVGAAVERAAQKVVLFDWARHEGYARARPCCDEVVLFNYGDAPQVVAREFSRRGWSQTVVALEHWSPTPSAPVIAALADQLREQGVKLVFGDWIVDELRLYKSPAELECVRRAAAIADAAMGQLQRDLKPGMTELEVSARLAWILANRGSEVAASPPLVNSGPTAWADTHSFPSRRVLQAGDTVAVDCCAVVNRYHANLARTFALGTPNLRAREILELASGSILELQRAARLGEGPESAAADADRYVRERVAAANIWWVGGYSLGIAMPPSWVGHAYLANDGPLRCRLSAGYVSNYETVFIDREEGFEAACIDTVVMTDAGLEVLSSLPRGLLEIGL